MPDRDDLDSWLDGRVDPLPPPPGTFDLIRRRARRRKYRRLAVTAGAAAAVVAAAVTVPQVVSLHALIPGPAASNVAAGKSAGATPSGGGSPATSTATPMPSSPAPGPVPPGFQPTSVTFVGPDTGWVIGQAGPPCATQYCTSVARTDDAGKTWTGVPAPLTGPPDGATGVGQIRFLNLENGWAFGPELFATHDGGRTWTQIGTNGLRVTDLETVGDRAFALFASCSGTGPAFAGQCISYTLYSTPASGDDWTPVGPSTSGLTGGGQAGGYGSASIVLTGTTGYLLAPDGMLYAGPVDGSAPWQPVARVPCPAGAAQPDGQPAGGLLGAETATDLIFACTPTPLPAPPPGGEQKKLIFASADGGASWQLIEPASEGPAAVAPAAGVATSLAASPAETVMLATNLGIDVLPAGSTTWQQATVTGGAPAGGFAFVGMTTATQGVAVPADAAAGTVWFTFDGGQTWQPSAVSSS
jgi:photosystem II stability/assembly factor-like uncharacterized protein